MQRTYTKVLHEIDPNVTKVLNGFPCFFFQIISDLLLTNTSRLDTLKDTEQTYLNVISIEDLAPSRPQIRIWYGILTWINQLSAIDLNMLASICRQQWIYCFCNL